jgi:hypothetical protein
MKDNGKNRRNYRAMAMIVLSLFMLIAGVALAEQNRYTLQAPNGIAFSEFTGYDKWQNVAVSRTDNAIKAILANPTMIKAYKEDIPGNGKPFPDGSVIVKIAWAEASNPASPYSVEVPVTLKSVAFIEKDSKRFPDTSGWGYAEFLYDNASHTFKPFGADGSFAKKVCYQCHTRVKARDYIFTNYAPR